LPARAEVVSLSPAADNTLYEDDAGALSNGAGERLFAGMTIMNARRRALIRFDFSPIPAGSQITGVTLRMNMSRGGSALADVSLHRALAPWGEGASDAEAEEGIGAPAAPGDATWIHRAFSTTPWTAPGGDFDPLAASTVGVGGVGPATWPSTPLLVAQAQSMLDDPSMNFGWLLLGDETSVPPTAKRFDSREHPTMANRPVLEVSYIIPAPGASAMLIATPALLRRRRVSTITR
jgi:hypothetical protein